MFTLIVTAAAPLICKLLLSIKAELKPSSRVIAKVFLHWISLCTKYIQNFNQKFKKNYFPYFENGILMVTFFAAEKVKIRFYISRMSFSPQDYPISPNSCQNCQKLQKRRKTCVDHQTDVASVAWVWLKITWCTKSNRKKS